MDVESYREQLNAQVAKIRNAGAVAAFFLSVGSVIFGALFDAGFVVAIMALASVTGGVLFFYLVSRRLGWDTPRNEMARTAFWPITVYITALLLASALVVWTSWRFGATEGAWSSLAVLGSEFLLGRELARARARGAAS